MIRELANQPYCDCDAVEVVGYILCLKQVEILHQSRCDTDANVGQKMFSNILIIVQGSVSSSRN